MDVHDPRLAPANRFKPSGGLSPEEVREALRSIAAELRVCGASVTAFDPDSDEDRKGLEASLELIGRIAEIAASP
jgi:arginase family enzyme